MKKISVIIPVYNVEKYIKQCLDSVINQTYKNLEILLVDDGSTDNSGTICDEYAKKDSRIKVIHKENGGLSSARNVALDIATGEYIAFVDSDDYIALDTFKKCFEKLEKTDADVCMFSHYTTNGQEHCVHSLPLEKEVYNQEEIQKIIIPSFIGQKTANEIPLLGLACRQVFKRETIGTLRFRSEREYYAEDVVFDLEFYANAKKMCILNEPLYYYRYVQTSLSNCYRENLFEKLIKLLNFKQEIIDKYNIEDCELRLLNSAFRAAIGGALNVKKATTLSKKDKRLKLMQIAKNPLVKKALKTIKQKSVKERVFALLLRLKWISVLMICI